MKLDYIFETALYVDDLGEARAFYERLLGTPAYAHAENRHVFFKLKYGMLLLFDPESTRAPQSALPLHGATGPGHVAFRVEPAEIAGWKDRLATLQIPVEKEWIWPNGALSIYFRDPAGNVLEITVGALWGF